MPLPLGLLSWLVIGCVSGLSANRLLPGRPPLGLLPAMAVGLVGACLGGLLATVLGFGGVAGFDFRSLVTATLGAMLCLLLFRSARLPV